jgi:hypothetical protein
MPYYTIPRIKPNSSILFLALIFCSLSSQSQILFERVKPLPPAPQIDADLAAFDNAAHDFGDIDQDEDLDLIIMGNSSIYLYLNDGTGNYSEGSTGELEGMKDGVVTLEDMDNDGDLDCLISGLINYVEAERTKLYFNDGTGHFSPSDFDPYNSRHAVGDFNGDDYPDILFYGGSYNVSTGTIFFNDGLGNFTSAPD